MLTEEGCGQHIPLLGPIINANAIAQSVGMSKQAVDD